MPIPDECEHEYDDATGEPCICPVPGCWFNDDNDG